MLKALKKMINISDAPSHPFPSQPWDGPYDSNASEADIYSCFRLLLGRRPLKTEWAGHVSALVGKPLKEVMLTYLSSTEFKTRDLVGIDENEIQQVQVDDYVMYVPIKDPQVGSAVYRDRIYEPHIHHFFDRLLEPGDCVIDIGANIGYFSMCAASRVGPEGKVYAFEPYSENVKMIYLSKRLNDFEQVEIIPMAASDRSGMCLFDNSGSNGFIRELGGSASRVINSTPVYMTQVDSMVPSGQSVKLIKIDVEGAEYMAIKGATDVIRQQRPTVVSEFSPEALKATSQVSAEQYLELFLAYPDYRFYVFQNEHLVPCGRDVQRVIDHYQQQGVDHIDIVATTLDL